MQYVQCKTCLGQYFTVSQDGVPYAHVCPPQVVTDYIDKGNIVTVVGMNAPQGFLPIRTYTRPIPGARDENVVSVDASGQPVLKSIGNGITLVSAVASV